MIGGRLAIESAEGIRLPLPMDTRDIGQWCTLVLRVSIDGGNHKPSGDPSTPLPPKTRIKNIQEYAFYLV